MSIYGKAILVGANIAVFRASFGKIFKNTWCSYIHVVLNVMPHQISLVVFIYYMGNTGFLHRMILLRVLLLPIFLAEYLLHGTRLRVTFSSRFWVPAITITSGK